MMDNRPKAGAIFVKGINNRPDFDNFLEECPEVFPWINELDLTQASSEWFGDVYLEYRPNVGAFDLVHLIPEEDDEYCIGQKIFTRYTNLPAPEDTRYQIGDEVDISNAKKTLAWFTVTQTDDIFVEGVVSRIVTE